MPSWLVRHAKPEPPTRSVSFALVTPPTDHVHNDQRVHGHKTRKPYSPPRQFDIITPSGEKVSMIFVERVKHITAPIEYGLVPADPKLRKYNEKGDLINNQLMELLSPKIHEDLVPKTFFFAERRSREKDPNIPTILEQLVNLRVLEVIPYVRTRSLEHNRAGLVKILLSDSEIAHSCSSPRHKQFMYEAPNFARFKVCTSCRDVPGRRGVYYCSEACLAADWKSHRIECGKSRAELEHLVEISPTIIRPPRTSYGYLRCKSLHSPPWHRAWLWHQYEAETQNVIDLDAWKANSRERILYDCKDMLPGF